MVDKKIPKSLGFRRQGFGLAIFYIQDFVLENAKKGRTFAVDETHVHFLHTIIMQGLEGAGHYRKISGNVGEHEAPPAQDVQKHMRDFVHQLNENWQKWDATEVGAFAIWRLNWIRPFLDGNGKTARLLCYWLINMRAGRLLPGKDDYLLPSLLGEQKYYTRYVDALKKGDKGSLLPMQELLEECLVTQLISREDKGDIREILANYGLSGDDVPISTKSLRKRVARHDLKAVNKEIERYLKVVDSDPAAAIQGACTVLEATLKAYLDKQGIEYEENEKITPLWQKVIEHIGMHPKKMDDKDMKKIASSLYGIIDGIRHLRNKKSTAHGKSVKALEQHAVHPRDSRLAVHASHAIACYVLEFME